MQIFSKRLLTEEDLKILCENRIENIPAEPSFQAKTFAVIAILGLALSGAALLNRVPLFAYSKEILGTAFFVIALISAKIFQRQNLAKEACVKWVSEVGKRLDEENTLMALEFKYDPKLTQAIRHLQSFMAVYRSELT